MRTTLRSVRAACTVVQHNMDGTQGATSHAWGNGRITRKGQRPHAGGTDRSSYPVGKTSRPSASTKNPSSATTLWERRHVHPRRQRTRRPRRSQEDGASLASGGARLLTPPACTRSALLTVPLPAPSAGRRKTALRRPRRQATEWRGGQTRQWTWPWFRFQQVSRRKMHTCARVCVTRRSGRAFARCMVGSRRARDVERSSRIPSHATRPSAVA
jgi:hypothetical protein